MTADAMQTGIGQAAEEQAHSDLARIACSYVHQICRIYELHSRLSRVSPTSRTLADGSHLVDGIHILWSQNNISRSQALCNCTYRYH